MAIAHDVCHGNEIGAETTVVYIFGVGSLQERKGLDDERAGVVVKDPHLSHRFCSLLPLCDTSSTSSSSSSKPCSIVDCLVRILPYQLSSHLVSQTYLFFFSPADAAARVKPSVYGHQLESQLNSRGPRMSFDTVYPGRYHLRHLRIEDYP